MANKRGKKSAIYEDAVRAATKTLTRVYGKAPKKSVVNAVAKRLVESLPPSAVSEPSKEPKVAASTSHHHVPLAAAPAASSHRLTL